MSDAKTTLTSLLDLSRDLGREDRELSILGEGNTSGRVTDETFLVKASGCNLATLTAGNVTECRFKTLLALLDQKKVPDARVDEALLGARVDPAAKKPSVEGMFHAWLLTLPGVNFVGHTHPVAINAIITTNHAKMFASRRLCPDEIVCCGAEFVLVPYVDPGLELARAIRRAVLRYIKRLSRPPRVILLENHGLIALGGTPEAVKAATFMAVKAAKIYAAACAIGAPRFLSAAVGRRIAGRPDEHYREKMIGLR